MAKEIFHSFVLRIRAVVARMSVVVMLGAIGHSAASGQDITLPSTFADAMMAKIFPVAQLSAWSQDNEQAPEEAAESACQLPRFDRSSFLPQPLNVVLLPERKEQPFERTNEFPNTIFESPFPSNKSNQNNQMAKPKFQWGQVLMQSLFFTSVMNGFRLATEPSTRADLKGPFIKDYLSSVKRLRGWRDGDSFLVNYIGHPMQGAVSGFIYVQNEPDRDTLELGLRKAYWKSRVKAMSWAFLLSTQFELGPFSEASFGNVGLKPSEKSQHPMGYVDLVVTPTLGTAWLVSEDTLDRYLIRKIEKWSSNRLVRALTRSFLNPTRSFANLMRFRPTWHRDDRSL